MKKRIKEALKIQLRNKEDVVKFLAKVFEMSKREVAGRLISALSWLVLVEKEKWIYLDEILESENVGFVHDLTEEEFKQVVEKVRKKDVLLAPVFGWAETTVPVREIGVFDWREKAFVKTKIYTVVDFDVDLDNFDELDL